MSLEVSPFQPLREEPPGEDRWALIESIDWETYELLREQLGNGLRLTYLRGSLEIKSPSYKHEDLKTLIARLLEAWAVERGVDLNGYGNVTLKKEREKALEPDECYSVGRVHETPDIAIEVVVSAGYIDKLEVYRGLGVREIWGYKGNSFTILALRGDAYEALPRSEVLPELDLDELAGFVKPAASQTAQVRAYQALLRKKG